MLPAIELSKNPANESPPNPSVLPATMRHLFLLIFVGLLPLGSRAQLLGGSFEPGAYILKNTPTEVHQADLQLRGSDLLLVREGKGAKQKLTPQEVAAFRIGDDKYVAVGAFNLRVGLGTVDVTEGFAQPLEMGGEVELLRYEFSAMAGLDRINGSAYLLRRGPTGSVVGIACGYYRSGGARFREQVRPFLASRPDILKCLDEKRINIDNLVGAIVALNGHVPFTPPAALNLE